MRLFFPLLLFLVLAPIASADVIITEIMYAPNNNWGGQYNDWIELYNNGSEDKDIIDWTIDGETIPQAVIPAGKYLILAKNSTKVRQIYGVDSIQMPFSLLNEGEMLNLTREGGAEADTSNYTMHAIAGLAKKNNHTLERNASGWFESIAIGGTPGAQNSIIAPETEEDEEPQNRNIPEQQKMRIEIIRSPSSMKFGDFGTIQARFYSGEKSFAKMRFVAYIFSPAWIAKDLTREENTLRNAPYNAEVAIELENIETNSMHNILLPLIIKCNPGGKYAGGTYTARVRAYSLKDGSWNDITEKDVQIAVSGENELCEKEECRSEPADRDKTENEGCLSEEAGSSIFDINITAPETAFIGRNFTTTVLLKNNGNATLDLELYSYLYEHSTIMSQGWNGEKWGNARTSNSRKVTLERRSSAEIELVSMPRENIGAEKYTFKVKMDDLNDGKNSREFVYLVKVENAPAGENAVVNRTGDEDAENEITGMIAAKTELSIWERIIEAIRRLFE